jgi:hypothetical protein
MTDDREFLDFTKPEPHEILGKWHLSLVGERRPGGDGDRAACAALRRAQEAGEAFEVAAFHRLRLPLKRYASFGDRDLMLARVALATAKPDFNVEAACAVTGGETPEVVVLGYDREKFPGKTPEPIQFGALTFAGTLTVVVPAAFRQALTGGLGAARGFGNGLIQIAPAQS